MKEPPERKNPSSVVISFSDCNTAEGTTFDDLYMPMIEWGKYMGEHGSTAGMWVFFPTYGGGGEEFDFKCVDAFQNLEDLGADWDHMNESGWKKANELFAGKVHCDSSRSYIATNRRRRSRRRIAELQFGDKRRAWLAAFRCVIEARETRPCRQRQAHFSHVFIVCH